MDKEHQEAVNTLKSILDQFTDEMCHYHNVDLARLTFPLNTIPYGIAPERWRMVNHPMYMKNKYMVSSWGRIYDIVNNHFPYTSLCDKGYIRVGLLRAEGSEQNSQGVSVRVHRLVAHTFIPKEEGKDTVNHIDLDKQNNTLENLEWLTNEDNVKHGLDNGAWLFRGSYSYFTKEEVETIKELHRQGKTLKSIAKDFNRKFRAISDVVNGRTYTDDFWNKMGQ